MEALAMVDMSVMRWTAKKKVEVVKDLYKGVYTLADFCRKHGLKQSDVSKWMETFEQGGLRGLKVNSTEEKILREAEIKELRAKVGELVLANEVLKKAKELYDEEVEETKL